MIITIGTEELLVEITCADAKKKKGKKECDMVKPIQPSIRPESVKCMKLMLELVIPLFHTYSMIASHRIYVYSSLCN